MGLFFSKKSDNIEFVLEKKINLIKFKKGLDECMKEMECMLDVREMKEECLEELIDTINCPDCRDPMDRYEYTNCDDCKKNYCYDCLKNYGSDICDYYKCEECSFGW